MFGEQYIFPSARDTVASKSKKFKNAHFFLETNKDAFKEFVEIIGAHKVQRTTEQYVGSRHSKHYADDSIHIVDTVQDSRPIVRVETAPESKDDRDAWDRTFIQCLRLIGTELKNVAFRFRSAERNSIHRRNVAGKWL